MDLKLNSVTGDLELGDNYTMRLLTTKQELTYQKVLIALNTNRGEWAFDISFGVPWIANENNSFSILSKVPKNIFDSAIKEVILSREGVTEIAEYSSVFDAEERTIQVDAKVLEENGDITIISQNVQA